jgi:HK97 family phage portal protein
MEGRGQVTAIVPLDPGKVAVERTESGRLRYRVSGDRGGVQIYLQEEILHLRFRLARDGIMGLSPVQLARETFNLALTQQDTAGKQASKSFLPEGALVFPNVIAGDQRQKVIDKLEAKVNSDLATRGVLVLDGGTDWKSFSFSSKDAEFLDSRKLTNLDICRIWAVPPTVAGITDNATYSNVDQEARARRPLPCSYGETDRTGDERRAADDRKPQDAVHRTRSRRPVARRHEGPLRRL